MVLWEHCNLSHEALQVCHLSNRRNQAAFILMHTKYITNKIMHYARIFEALVC